MKKNNLKIKSGAGFTLIEILVAISVFSIIISSISGIFVFSVREQRKTLTSQILLDQTSYVLEYMSRSLRMARKQIAGEAQCLSQSGLNYEIPSAYQEGNENLGRGIRFINQLQGNDCQEFYLENGQLKYKKNVDDPPNSQTFDLTSNNLNITFFRFNLSGKDQSADYLQPTVIFFLEIEGKGGAVGTQPKIKIQTTISQRMLDVQY
jgi:prepilin-type N-terminal cleavage/methylation domain-containing protein